jgi:hypothetical protein
MTDHNDNCRRLKQDEECKRMKKGQRGPGRDQPYLYLSMPPGPAHCLHSHHPFSAPAASNLVRILLRRSQPANGSAEPNQPLETYPCLASMG